MEICLVLDQASWALRSGRGLPCGVGGPVPQSRWALLYRMGMAYSVGLGLGLETPPSGRGLPHGVDGAYLPADRTGERPSHNTLTSPPRLFTWATVTGLDLRSEHTTRVVLTT